MPDDAMAPDQIVRRAFEVFAADVDEPPPLTLRGANAVDSYDEAGPFDAAADEPTDAYIEHFAFWGLGYLDARSWRHYLPRLMSYALRRPDDPAMAVEALVRSLRPPDRYPPRLMTLTVQQESVVREFLEALALHDGTEHVRDEIFQALEEWWLPDARARPTPEEVTALRSAPVSFQVTERPMYRLTLPRRFTSSGPRHIPEEARTVEVWSGLLCGDAPATVAVNVIPLAGRHLHEMVDRAATGLRAASVRPARITVPGSSRSTRLDGLTRGDSPAEPESVAIVGAVVGPDVVLLTVRSWPRDDVEVDVERIVRSLEILARDP